VLCVAFMIMADSYIAVVIGRLSLRILGLF
jgi:hypothetical protein